MSLSRGKPPKVKIYLNPVVSELHLDNIDGSEVSIYDVMGNRIYQKANVYKDTIETEYWINGIYFIQIRNEKGYHTTKIINPHCVLTR